MKHPLIWALLPACLAGCADLTVTHTQVVWNDQMKIAAARVANTGFRASGATMLYFDGDENPTSPNHRPQVQAEIGALAPGQSVTRLADFAPLAHPDNQMLRNVYAVTARVDPKNLVNEWNEGNNARQQAAPGAPYTCVTFDNFTAGTVFGTPSGQAPGTVIFSQGGASATIERFSFVGGAGSAFNFARVDAVSGGFGSGNVLRFNNINLDFDFTGVTNGVTQVVFRYADLGGFENLAVNGLPLPIYAGELTSAPATVGGALVTSTANATPGGKTGAVALLQLGGTISRLRFGGQEYFVDDVCYR